VNKKRVVIVGGGPAGLMAATQLLETDCELIIIEQKPTIGRKFLVAGDGGFNLTHSEHLDVFIEKYDCEWIRNCVRQFDSTAFRDFLLTIGVPTIIGSSGKVFPEDHLKPIDVLNSWKKWLSEKVDFQVNSRLTGFSEKSVSILTKGISEEIEFDFLVFALGGASWPKTGSDGRWTELFRSRKIDLVEFSASNSGVELDKKWLGDSAGKILKNVVVSCNTSSCPGDVVCTEYGLEGKPIYAMNVELRKQTHPQLLIDLKPQFSAQKVFEVLQKAKTPTQGLKDLKLSQLAISWIKAFVSKEKFMNPTELTGFIKAFPVDVKGFRSLDEVISSAGGVATTELKQSGELIKYPGVFCAGEMIDWDAPTGGYLIQGCVSSGYVVGQAIKKRLLTK
jgi:uncharacterized flavoprotein (TIGR03862 family)